MQAIRGLASFFSDLNAATLSGAIDMVAVEGADGELRSTPFHVRFGKLQGVLLPREKKVDITVNGVPATFGMKLGAAGEAFFVVRSSTPVVEPAYACSPLMSPLARASPCGAASLGSDMSALDLQARDYEEGAAVAAVVAPTRGDATTCLPLVSPPLGALSASIEAAREAEAARCAREDSGGHGYTMLSDGDFDTDDSSSLCSPPTSPTHNVYPSSSSRGVRGESAALQRRRRSEGSSAEAGGGRNGDVAGRQPSQRWKWGWGDMPARKKRDLRHTATAAAASRAGGGLSSQPPTPRRRAWSEGGVEEEDGDADADDDDEEDEEEEKGGRSFFRKSLRPSSEQLRSLDLRFGANEITFTVRARGKEGGGGNKVTLAASLFLLRPTARVVVANVDGCITKSDKLGQIMNAFGRDGWTHEGVTNVFDKLSQNGYQILYLTGRAIGQATWTKDYLNCLTQNGKGLPPGPVLLSPDRLFDSIGARARGTRGFKCAALMDIRALFPSDQEPFYAGFGHSVSDAQAYRSVSVPRGRIFTIDKDSRITHSDRTATESYATLAELVDVMFPPFEADAGPSKLDAAAFNAANFWRQPFLF